VLIGAKAPRPQASDIHRPRPAPGWAGHPGIGVDFSRISLPHNVRV